METIIVHSRINSLHPEITKSDVLEAWGNIIHSKTRLEEDPYQYVAIGVDNSGRLIEMVAVRLSMGDILIFHAMTPPSKKTLKELELYGGKRK